MATVFISNVAQDSALAESIAIALIKAGHRPRHDRPGIADVVILIASPQSIGNAEVITEAARGVCTRKPLLVVVCGLPYHQVAQADPFWEAACYGEAPVQLLRDRAETVRRIVARVAAIVEANEPGPVAVPSDASDCLRLGFYAGGVSLAIEARGSDPYLAQTELIEGLPLIRRLAGSLGIRMPRRVDELVDVLTAELVADQCAGGLLLASLFSVGHALSAYYRGGIRFVAKRGQLGLPIPPDEEELLDQVIGEIEKFSGVRACRLDLSRMRALWSAAIADARQGRGDVDAVDDATDAELSRLYQALDDLGLDALWAKLRTARRNARMPLSGSPPAASVRPFADVFISNSPQDAGTARSIADALERAGYSSVFRDTERLPPTCTYQDIVLAIQNAHVVLTIVSPHSLKDDSLLISDSVVDDRADIPVLSGVSYKTFRMGLERDVAIFPKRVTTIDLDADGDVAMQRIISRVGVAVPHDVAAIAAFCYRREMASAFLLGFRVAAIERMLASRVATGCANRYAWELSKQFARVTHQATTLFVDAGPLGDLVAKRLRSQLDKRNPVLGRVMGIGLQVGACHFKAVRKLAYASAYGLPARRDLRDVPARTIRDCEHELACDPLAPAIDLSPFEYVWEESRRDERSQSVDDSFSLTDETRRALREVCSSIEGT